MFLNLRVNNVSSCGAMCTLLTMAALAAPPLLAEPAVVFPDGERVKVVLRRFPHVPDIKGASLADEYADLRRTAENGDGDAAFALYQALKRCALKAPSDEEALSKAVETLHQTRRIDLPGLSEPANYHGTSPLADLEEDLLRAPFEFCKGITAAQKDERESWFAAARVNGNLFAAIEYAWRADTSETILDAANEAWGRGHILSLGRIANVYRQGSDGSPPAMPDPVKAYAYSWLEAHLLDTVDGEKKGLFTVRAEARMTADARNLRPHELPLAMDKAKEILKANENCCLAW